MASRYTSRSRKHPHTCTVRPRTTKLNSSQPHAQHYHTGRPLLLGAWCWWWWGIAHRSRETGTAEGHSTPPRGGAAAPATLYLGRESHGTGALATRAIHHPLYREQGARRRGRPPQRACQSPPSLCCLQEESKPAESNLSGCRVATHELKDNETLTTHPAECCRKESTRPCLIPEKFCKIFQIPRHIESLDACMKY